jgi:DHA2 family multidrug resistance protein
MNPLMTHSSMRERSRSARRLLELSQEEPIVDIRLFGHRQFATCSLIMLVVHAILFSSTQLIPPVTANNLPHTTTLSGLVMMPGGW